MSVGISSSAQSTVRNTGSNTAGMPSLGTHWTRGPLKPSTWTAVSHGSTGTAGVAGGVGVGVDLSDKGVGVGGAGSEQAAARATTAANATVTTVSGFLG